MNGDSAGPGFEQTARLRDGTPVRIRAARGDDRDKKQLRALQDAVAAAGP